MSDLEELARKATPGPWRLDKRDWRGREKPRWAIFGPGASLPGLIGRPIIETEGMPEDNADAAYIVALVNAAPALLALARESSVMYHRVVHDKQTLLWDCPDEACAAARKVLGGNG